MAKARKVNRASFGNVRQLASGRWQARYPAEDGTPMNAPRTFDTSAEAWQHIAQVSADRSRHTYTDPRKGERLLVEFAQEWIDNGGSRGHLAVGTTELYRDLLDRHIAPTIGQLTLTKISPDVVRTWHTKLAKELAASAAEKRSEATVTARPGAARTRQAYALLKSILATAENDDLIGRNPARIRGAGVAKSPERPLMSPKQFVAIRNAHPEELRAVLDLALGAHLRLGEVVGLRRGDLDLEHGQLTIERQVIQTRWQGKLTTEPKTSQRRVVDIPVQTQRSLEEYLKTIPKALKNAPLFVMKDGTPITRTQLQHNFIRARNEVDLKQFHFHDMRGAGLSIIGEAASIDELKKAGGHSTVAAAMTYQHASGGRGKMLAQLISDAIEDAEKQA